MTRRFRSPRRAVMAGGLAVVCMLASGVAALPASASSSASVVLDMQVSVNGGSTWQDVGVGVLNDPTVGVGQSVKERAIVTNTGNLALDNVSVSELVSSGSAAPAAFTFAGASSFSLGVGQKVISDVLTVATLPGHQIQTGTVTATVSGTTTTVTASDQVDYTGPALYYQTITFTGPGTGTVGASTTLSGTGGASGNPVVFSVDASSATGVCTTSGTNGTTLTYTGAGTCVIDANQAGSADYAAAAQVSQTITANLPTVSDVPRISANQAEADATSFVTAQGLHVVGVKSWKLTSSGQKDFYKVKIDLARNRHEHGTATVWVDATSSPGTVTAVSGGGLNWRDANVVSEATAETNALAALGNPADASSYHSTRINAGKWEWYWVFIINGSTKYKIGVDAITGVVTIVSSPHTDDGHRS